MTLTIDSKTVDLPRSTPTESFTDYSNRLTGMLLEDNLAIASLLIDGEEIEQGDDIESKFAAAKSIAVTTVPLGLAVKASFEERVTTLGKLEEDCQNLVTDCLLAEPQDIARSWEALCGEIRDLLSFLPCIEQLMTEEQVNYLIDQKLTEVRDVMQEMHLILNEADVVKMSDVLELKLLSWLTSMKEFLCSVQPAVEKLVEQNS